jgi:hypothetical protein
MCVAEVISQYFPSTDHENFDLLPNWCPRQMAS